MSLILWGGRGLRAASPCCGLLLSTQAPSAAAALPGCTPCTPPRLPRGQLCRPTRGLTGVGHLDTIFALSTGAGRAALAVVRMSGPATDEILRAMMMRPASRPLPEPRMAVLSALSHPTTGEALDEAIVLRFPGPRSFTGEDAAELHVHGGPAVVQGVLGALAAFPAARAAEAGEFSKRALHNGKLDLTSLEGLADLLGAETPAQRRQALAQAGGAHRRLYEEWRGRLLRALAHVEAVIDFGEEEEIADSVAVEAAGRVHELRRELDSHLEDGRVGEVVREGARVALLGAPNAGKSSLLNALSRREAAIVSPIPGTTRDVVEVVMDVGGYRAVVGDCAGLRATDDPVEAEGVRRAARAAREADIRVVVLDGSLLPEGGGGMEWYEEAFGPWVEGEEGGGGSRGAISGAIVAINKIDLLVGREGAGAGAGALRLPALAARLAGEAARDIRGRMGGGGVGGQGGGRGGEGHCIHVSCKTGEGLAALEEALAAAVAARCARGGGQDAAPAVTRLRHRRHLAECSSALGRYLELAAAHEPELAAEEIRAATRALGMVTGAVDVEEVLGTIFSEFCIGK